MCLDGGQHLVGAIGLQIDPRGDRQVKPRLLGAAKIEDSQSRIDALAEKQIAAERYADALATLAPILAPVLVLWLGFGILPKLVVIALVSFFSIVVTTLAGFASVDPDLLKLMQTFDASRRRVFWSIELPTALPGVFTGAKIAVIFAVIGAVFFTSLTGGDSASYSRALGHAVIAAICFVSLAIAAGVWDLVRARRRTNAEAPVA